MANQGAANQSSGIVNHLDTINFNQTILAYNNYIKQFENIVNGVNRTTDTIISNWKGEGCDAFNYDCQLVKCNLKEISGIMYEIRDALINAHAEYMKSDAALSKSFES